MKILNKKILRGPNYWSNYRKKLIDMLLDIEEFEFKPTNQIKGFSKRIKEVLPTLYFHGCSYKSDGGLFKRIEEGTWAGHVIEHIALEIQSLAGSKVGFGRTRSSHKEGVYHVVFSYEEEEAGLYTADASVEIFIDISNGISINEIRKKIANHISQIKYLVSQSKLGPSTNSIVKEAIKRDIPVIRLDKDSYVQLGYGIKQKRIQATITSKTSYIAVELACDKYDTKRILEDAGVPVPASKLITEINELKSAVEEIGFPVAVKPLDSSKGKGVTVNINNFDLAKKAFTEAKKYSDYVMVEKTLHGKDFRSLVINHKFVAAAERIPAHVIGNGENTISELVDFVNLDPSRGMDHENFLSKINIDENTIQLLQTRNLTLDSVLPDGEICYLKTTANLSTGGTAIDRTEEVHPQNILLFERISKIINLDIAGIDIIAEDLSIPLTNNNGGIIEVNASPGFRMHLSPTLGKRRNVGKHVLKMLFPNEDNARIPVIAVTGTNGKTTTTRLISHIIKSTGKSVGYTTSDGIYINDLQISSGDNTGPISAQTILKDPSVEVAVLETARGGILRSGLGFDHSDIGIVLNVSEDHLGIDDIHSLKDMQRVKEVVARSVKENGFAILNADDPLVYEMINSIDGKPALFSMENNNLILKEHIKIGGAAAFLKDDKIYLTKENKKIFLCDVKEIPATFNGQADFMIQNVLAASLACFIHGIEIETIKKSLQTFSTAGNITPGRMNLIDIGNFKVLVDFAHNPAAFNALKRFIKKNGAQKVTGIFGGTGDRRNEDLIHLGKIAATMFTNIIIKEESYLRGRPQGEMFKLISLGIKETDPDIPVKFIQKEMDALNYALQNVEENELIVLLCDKIDIVLMELLQLKNEFAEEFQKSETR